MLARSKIVLSIFVVVALLGVLGAASSSPQLEIAVFAYESGPIPFMDPSDGGGGEICTMVNVYEPLLRYRALTDEFIPVLATDYEKSEDGLTWTFQLRKGVKFHTGNEMDAEAVKFSFERTMERGRGSSYILAPVKSIEAVDKYTIRFHLKYRIPFDLLVTSNYCAFVFDPKFSDHEWFVEGHDSGTGPYKIESIKGREEVVLAKFDDYWGGWRDKYFDKVVIKEVVESSTRRLMLESGAADYVVDLPPTDIKALEDNPDIKITTFPSFQNLVLLYNTLKPPLDNQLVRRALACLIPYQDVTEAAMGGYARPSRGVLPYSLWGHSDRVEQFTFSPTVAKELLAQAGYPDGFDRKLLVIMPEIGSMRKTAELWQSELAEFNIELDIRSMPPGSRYEMARSPDPAKRQDIFILWWWPEWVHPDSFLTSLIHTEEQPAWNLSYYSNPLIDNLLNVAQKLSATDREGAAELYVEIQNIIANEAPAIPIFDVEYVTLSRASLKGCEYDPAWLNILYWYNCYREE